MKVTRFQTFQIIWTPNILSLKNNPHWQCGRWQFSRLGLGRLHPTRSRLRLSCVSVISRANRSGRPTTLLPKKPRNSRLRAQPLDVELLVSFKCYLLCVLLKYSHLYPSYHLLLSLLLSPFSTIFCDPLPVLCCDLNAAASLCVFCLLRVDCFVCACYYGLYRTPVWILQVRHANAL